MSDTHKKLLKELDALIQRVPDVDMDVAFSEFLKKYETEMQECRGEIAGLSARLIFVLDFIRFQINIMLGGDLKTSLKSLLIWAETMGHKEVLAHLADKERMQKMAHLLEKKARTLRPSEEEQVKKWAQ